MKKFIVSLLVLPIALSCSSRRFDLDPHRVEPSFNLAAIWFDGLDDYYSRTVLNQVRDLKEDSCCHSKYSKKKDYYSFNVYRMTDTVTIDISKLYIESNLDFVKILVDDASNSSYLEVYLEAGFAENGRMFGYSGITNYMCNLQASRPVKVSVFLFLDFMDSNVNKTMYEYRRENFADSLRRNLDSVINTLKID